MAQVRIVLKDEVIDIGQELLELTRLSSLSELTSLLYSRYAAHLKATWEVQAAAPEAIAGSTFPAQPLEVSHFDEPIQF